jgi:hypothetical protein
VSDLTWPQAILILGLIALVIFLLGAAAATWLEVRKARMVSGQEDALRQLIGRYEQLAEKTLDSQQRAAADLAGLHTRTASIEQILRSVDQ